MPNDNYTADRRLYLDKEGNLVEADDPKKNELLVAEGGTLSAEDAAKYGLTGEKAAKGPEENKAASPAKAKGKKK